MGFFNKIKTLFKSEVKEDVKEEVSKYEEGLSKSRVEFTSKLGKLSKKYRQVTEDYFDELEEILIMADIGVNTVMEFMDRLRKRVDKEKITDLNQYKAKKKTVDEYFDGSNYEILLVDDNLLNLKVAEKLLKKYNLKVTSVSSGLECINYTKNKKYDLIFLDHMMPEMDGIHTLYNLKKRVSGFDTPVVVLTANAIEGSKDMYLKEGFVDYLSKPINQVELDRILREQLHIDEE